MDDEETKKIYIFEIDAIISGNELLLNKYEFIKNKIK